MAIVVNQLRDVHGQSVQSIMIVKLINNVKVAHAEIHVCSLALAVLMHNVVLLTDRNNALVLRATLEIQPLNVRLKQMHAHATRADRIQDAEMLLAAMNVHAHPVVLVIHIKDVYAVNRAQFVQRNHVDEMQHAELSIKMNPNVIARHYIQVEIHTLNVSFIESEFQEKKNNLTDVTFFE